MNRKVATMADEEDTDIPQSPSSVPPEVPTQDPSWSLQGTAGSPGPSRLTNYPFRHCCGSWGS